MDVGRKEKPHTRGNPMIYAPSRVRGGPKKNNLTVSELHRYFEVKTPSYLLHNIYKVLLRVMYHRPHYMFFDTIRHPCDGLTTMVTLTHLENKKVFMLDHTCPTFDGLLNPHVI